MNQKSARQDKHQDLVGFIWSVADKLRVPYRPPQYRRVMLPLIILRRLDCVLEGTKPAVLAAKKKLEAKGLEGVAFEKALSAAGFKLAAPVKKAVLAALIEQNSAAEICRDSKGNPEPDSSLRDTEIVPLPEDIALPLPLDYGKKASNAELLALVANHCEAYLVAEMLPHVPDAWIDHGKTKVGYEIPLNRHFYMYEPPRPLSEIEDDIKALEKDIVQMLGNIV